VARLPAQREALLGKFAFVNQRLATLGFDKRYGTKNPFSFMAQHDVQEVGPEGVLWR
jgi:hypothetical protein